MRKVKKKKIFINTSQLPPPSKFEIRGEGSDSESLSPKGRFSLRL